MNSIKSGFEGLHEHNMDKTKMPQQVIALKRPPLRHDFGQKQKCEKNKKCIF